LISLPEVWDRSRLRSMVSPATTLWCTRSVRPEVEAYLGMTASEPSDELPDSSSTLVVVGGGTLIDRAKVTARKRAGVTLIAVPSIWGSGAEASPIVVDTTTAKKSGRLDLRFLPDARVTWPELGMTVSPARAAVACGDVWAHALEAFLSPLGSVTARSDAASLLDELVELPLSFHPAWFEASARACAVQAAASVGLVHGIAHVLELLTRDEGNVRWSHAGLCSNWLSPVLQFDLERAPHLATRFAEHGISLEPVLRRIAELGDAASLAAQRAALSSAWRDILRDPSTRTNCALVRPADLEYFQRSDVPTS